MSLVTYKDPATKNNKSSFKRQPNTMDPSTMSPKRHPHKPGKNESFKRQSNLTLKLVLWELILVSYDLFFQADFWEFFPT
jgi:hypothetical protein